MASDHGGVNQHAENFAGTPSFTLSRRSSEQNKFRPMEPQVSALFFKDAQDRTIVFTMVTVGLDEPVKFLAPFLLPAQRSDSRNQLASEDYSDTGGLELLSPPAAIFLDVNLQKAQEASPPENTGSATPLSTQSSGPNVLGQSRNRSRRTKSTRSLRTSSASSLISNKSSGLVLDNLNAVHPDLLISECPKVGNHSAKKSSRKKRKKKDKRYRQSFREEVTVGSETQCEEGISSASVYDIPVKSDPAGSGDCISEDNFAENATSSTLSVNEKADSKVYSIGSIKGSTGSLACSSYANEIDMLVPMTSSLQGSAANEFSCKQLDMDEVCTFLSNTSSSVRPQETILTVSGGNATHSCTGQSTFSHDISPSNSLDQSKSTVMDSLLDALTSDLSEICTGDIDVQLSVQDESEFSSSNSESKLMINGTAYQKVHLDSDVISRSPDRSTEVFNNHNRAETVQCSGQASTSDDFQPVVYGKRGRLARKNAGSSNAVNKYDSVNMLSRTGKDSSQSVLHKVQRNDAEECIHDPNNLPADNSSKASETRVRLDTKQSQSAKLSKSPCSYKMALQAELQKTAFSGVASNEFLCKSNNVKMKPSSVSKQSSHCSWKGSLSHKTNVARPSKVQIPQKDGSEISQKMNRECIISGLKSPCSTNLQNLMATPANKSGFYQLEEKIEGQSHIEESTSIGNACSIIHAKTSLAQDDAPLPAEDNQREMLPASDFFDRTCIREHHGSSNTSSSSKPYDNMHVDNCHPVDRKDNISMKPEAENADAEQSKSGYCSGSLMQEWVPIVGKDPIAREADEAVSDSSSPKNAEVVSSLNSHHSLPLTVCGLECHVPSSEDPNGRSAKADRYSGELKSHPNTEEEIADVLAVSNCHLTDEVKKKCQFEADDDLNVILRAVTDAYKFQTASESVHVVTGNPVAEFERFLHSASPVLGQIGSFRSCDTCPQGQLIGSSLCPHQIPNFSLASLWHWYERPGSYGLEVKVKDHNNSKRLQSGHLKSCAYFVPYLSAVQLFGRANNLMYSSKEISSGESIGASIEDKEIKTSSLLSSLPIFSKLLPQPCKKGIKLSRSSSSAKEDLCDGSNARHMNDKEVLFEYFESDQPQQRPPLYEKIKELVRADASSAGKMFGNPLNLESLRFHDLHPASWYSVAWYPIYRIPSGKFRAAFLTYHSLGHFAHREVSPNSSDGIACLVSPVVGLQSYNVKGECWFQPLNLKKTQVVQTEESEASDPSQILKERLRTLEQTASAMARASVWKGNQRSVNRQSDYEFFLSRGGGGFSF